MIKTDMAQFANRRTKAKKYSAKVQAEREARKAEKREKLNTLKAGIIGLLILVAAGIAGTVTDMPVETKAMEMEINF